MKASVLRWLLDPLTSLLALRLWSRERGRRPYDAAWRLARVMRHPDELVYRVQGHRPDDPEDSLP
ncbi:hypothetical protein [Streptomyces buecherae]|uniref:hypothetical protein n=1 Tax=Streptomyces buecherae TaxID=2763006 RepID=UPI001C272DDF|nr:hypothetical protein [Streptomyces buecherae]